MKENLDGFSNTAIGVEALKSNTTGYENVGVGDESLWQNVSGYRNASVGIVAMQQNTIGHNNAAFGGGALSENTTGNYNAALGDASLLLNTSGSFNTAIGPLAMTLNTGGIFNAAFGAWALTANTNGNFNTAIGPYADVASGSLSNATALGNGAIVNNSNKIRFGNTSVTVVEGNASYTVSDCRFKTNVKQNVPGLDFITRLQPVTYHFDYPSFSNFIGERNVDRVSLEVRKGKVEAGFVAQQVEEVCLSLGMDYSNLVHAPENEQDNYSLSYTALVVPLVQAVQEQQVMIENKDEEIRTLQQQLIVFQDRLAQIESLLGIKVDTSTQIVTPSSQTEQMSVGRKNEIKTYPLPPFRPVTEMPAMPEYTTQKAKTDSANQ